MRNLFTGLLVGFLFAWAPAQADDQPVVVELYTSQGCSSCPPADAFLSELTKNKNVIALALHVDYWDYLGWKDEFASVDYSNRQRAYASAANKRTIYTPQVVVQGTNHAIGNRINDVAELISHHTKHKSPVTLDIKRDGVTLTISAAAKSGNVGPTVIQLVRYTPERTISIRAGENAGRKILYSNIVTSWQPLKQWNGKGDITVRAKAAGSDKIVILVQALGMGPIIAAELLP